MKQGFYLYFHGIVKNKKVSVLMAILAYWVFCFIYRVKCLFSSKDIVELESKERVHEKLNAISPKPESKYDIKPMHIDENIDLSIIVPVYNYENLLDHMINSILNQNTHYSFELILVDDGSAQPAKDVLKRYENHEHVKIIYQENMGISGARNTGIDAATGRYIMFVDCDDVVHENIVETLLNVAYKKDADIVMGAHALVKENDGKIIRRREEIYPKYNIGGYEREDYKMNFPGLPWGKVYKHSIFENVRFPVNYWYEDTLTQFICFRLAKRFIYVPKVLYEYKWYEGNYSKVKKKSTTKVLDHYWIIEYMIEEGRKLGLPDDDVLYRLVLKHLGTYLYGSVRNLENNQIRTVFSMGCILVRDLDIKHPVKLNYQLGQLEQCFKNRDFNQWLLICKYL